MTSRPWLTWLAAAACVTGVTLAMLWLTREALDLERAQRDAKRQAELEETVRLALWRMDSAMGTILAEESNRPYFAYSSFYPAQRAYTNMLNEVGPGEVRIPSELLTYFSPHVLLHFQHEPGGAMTSPQAPAGNVRAAAMKGFVTRESIQKAESRLNELAQLAPVQRICEAAPPLRGDTPQAASLNTQARVNAIVLNNVEPRPQSSGSYNADINRIGGRQGKQSLSQSDQTVEQMAAVQNMKGQVEYQRRSELQEMQNSMGINAQAADPEQTANLSRNRQAPTTQPSSKAEDAPGIMETPMRPVSIGGQLLLVRRVRASGREFVQGCWLNWPTLRTTLLDQMRDLLPEATLTVVEGDFAADPSRMMATIPVRLQPGAVPASAMAIVDASPLSRVLTAAWAAVIVAALAIGALLWGAIALSERRAAFVSAVTHELRTPLTTFRLYTELLAEGRVADETKRQGYLRTLRAEAERLTHLVDNVLAHARLERNAGRRGTSETLAMGSVIERVRERLARRAEQADFELVTTISPEAAEAKVEIDALSVEQVLVNLVDNACKYAASADDRRLELTAERAGATVRVSLTDHGPGVAADAARRLFVAFSKSSDEAAQTAPGVGLGLSLSRRLARAMNGDLACESLGKTDCAVFVLTLPVRA